MNAPIRRPAPTGFAWPVFACGLLFGYILQRAGATDYDAIARMFLLEDFHLAGLMCVAMVVAGLGLGVVRRARSGALARYAEVVKTKPMKPGLVIGALLFGCGWAITGTCPGTGLAQLGEGKLMALFTVAGMLLGTAIYLRVGARVEAWLDRSRR
jgi:uncharacterized membrane protein YedE/YeeE